MCTNDVRIEVGRGTFVPRNLPPKIASLINTPIHGGVQAPSGEWKPFETVSPRVGRRNTPMNRGVNENDGLLTSSATGSGRAPGEGTRPTGGLRDHRLLTSAARALFLTVTLVGLVGSADAQSSFERLKSFGNAAQSGADPYGALRLGTDGALYGTTYFGGTNNSGTVFKVSTNGTGYTVLHLFGGAPADGANPRTGLIRGSDGALYGIAGTGGTNNAGAIFRLNQDGSGYTLVYTFSTATGYYPRALFQATNGMLYGSTGNGGAHGVGTLFQLSTNGTGYVELHQFGTTTNDGYSANALMQASDGALYGTCYAGGAYSGGTVYKLNPDGTGYTLLHTCIGPSSYWPSSPLIQGSDGMLYGVSQGGGSSGYGTVYKLNTDGSGFTILHNFSNSGGDGTSPAAPLWQAPDGTLYGTTSQGGPGNYGTVFKLSTNGTGYAVLRTFANNGLDPQVPDALIPGSNGALYCLGNNGGASYQGALFTINTNGTGYALLYSFSQTGGDGANPYGDLIQGRDGLLYGTTQQGGSGNEGTVFSIQTNGTGLALLHSFDATYTNGAQPNAAVLQAADGALYGTDLSGGASGVGTLFKLNTNGTGFSTLWVLGAGTDGQMPLGPLIQGADGALYGTAYFGGTYFGGTVFKVNRDGSDYTNLYSFGRTATDGADPSCGLIQANDGLLYGTTQGGGSNGYGTVFRISTNGSGYAVLYNFRASGGDAQGPSAGLVQASDGALYGTTYGGGTAGRGAVFKLNLDGSGYAVLHSFTGVPGDLGNGPQSRLIQASDGALYGTTAAGGIYGQGTVYGITTNGGFGVFYNFGATPGDGSQPNAGVVQGSDGALYGVAFSGGDMNYGTLFRLVPVPPPPMLARQPANVTNYPFATASFSVGVNSFAPGNYQWYFNSSPIAGATSSSVSVLVNPAQLGGYSVTFTNLYGAVTSTVATLSMLAPTQALQTVVLHNFGAAPGDGQWPMAGLLQATNGQLFGTTYGGGAYGNGTVFLLNTNGSGYTTRAQFGGVSGDAARPEAALIQGNDGALYGTAAGGGAYGYGAAYRIANPTGPGAPVLIHSFGGSERGDGSEPYAPLLQLSDGFLYGTTVLDGASGYGALFRLSTDGATYSLRNSFSPASGGGIHPYAGIVLGADGTLYGTTYSGGAYGYGTVFRLANPASGPGPQWLHSFTNSGGDGGYPYAGVAQGSDGTLYGTTWSGGADGAGTVFGLNADGSGYAVRVNFSGTNGSGANPYGGVVVGNDGALYGTTYSGGAYGYGTLFRVRNPAGPPVLEYLHSFSNTNGDGGYPVGGLLQAADGSLFGTTSSGGAAGEGTVYAFAFDPHIVVPPTNQVAALGSAVSFNVVAAGTGPFTYQWLFNGNPLPGATNPALTLSNVTTNQTGGYAVVVFGAAGTVTSQPASLGVAGPPVFTSVARLADGNVRLTLSVAPNASYSIQTSSNLVNWVTQTNVFATSLSIQVTDLTATNATRKFYRAAVIAGRHF